MEQDIGFHILLHEKKQAPGESRKIFYAINLNTAFKTKVAPSCYAKAVLLIPDNVCIIIPCFLRKTTTVFNQLWLSGELPCKLYVQSCAKQINQLAWNCTLLTHMHFTEINMLLNDKLQEKLLKTYYSCCKSRCGL